jgi:DNA-binding HxlR family transcriptional regulator
MAPSRQTGVPLCSCQSLAEAFDFLGRRWTGLLVHTLAQRPARFAELRRAITGISDRVLSQRLEELSARQLVTRRKAADGRAHYALTADGEALAAALEHVCDWAQRDGVNCFRSPDPG